MIGAPVPGVVNALQVTIPGRSPSVPSVKALGNARERKKRFLFILQSSLLKGFILNAQLVHEAKAAFHRQRFKIAFIA